MQKNLTRTTFCVLFFGEGIGTYTFTPTANFNGTVDLTYGVTDGTATLASQNGTATLADQTRSFTVTAVNDAPVGVNDSAATAFNTAVTIQASTLLANDTDVDSTFRSITAVSGVTNGTAVLNNNGTVSNTADDYIVFTPTTGFSGDASFNYTVSDGSLTGTATVTVAVGGSITGGNGADNLTGTNGNDSISSGNGNDTLYGGLGSDTLTGGNGQDVFAYTGGDGSDTITDFRNGDKIGLYGGLTFGQLSFSGSNILVTSTNEILATLTGVNTTTLTAANFVNL